MSRFLWFTVYTVEELYEREKEREREREFATLGVATLKLRARRTDGTESSVVFDNLRE